jgi:transcriptional regulator with XRE-family HTH domain
VVRGQGRRHRLGQVRQGINADALIRDARTAAGLTQAELARRLGTSQPAVVKLERPGANPTVRTLDRVLRATGHRLELAAPAWSPGVDESLIRKQLELAPADRLRDLERHSAQVRRLMIAGARSRGELS